MNTPARFRRTRIFGIGKRVRLAVPTRPPLLSASFRSVRNHLASCAISTPSNERT